MNPFHSVASGAALFPETRRRHRVFSGLNERQEHIFTWISVIVILLYGAAWIGAIDHIRLERRQLEAEARAAGLPVPLPPPPSTSHRISTSILRSDAPKAAYITDAMLGFIDPLRGASGKLRVALPTPGSPITTDHGHAAAVLTAGKTTQVSPDFAAPDKPGLYKLAVQIDQATRQIDDFSVITLVPFGKKDRGKIGLYYLGSWPYEGGGKPRSPAYANPSGFIEVTPQNADTYVSEHFRLRDFLTKGQNNVWPKYLLLNPKMLDKLELTIAELKKNGVRVQRVAVMSGFRTPGYNAGGGNVAGRANLSRHMYGDASDIFVDNDGNGTMDDINGDGRSDTRDAELISQAVERVERAYPELVGGVGVYSACCGHGPFTHIDVRGYRARWRGTGNG